MCLYFSHQTRKLVLGFIVSLLLVSVSFYAQALINAVQQTVYPAGPSKCNVRYASARIKWSNPSLHFNLGGSFNRVGITRDITPDPSTVAQKFIEIGWLKQVQPGVLGIPVITEWINVTYRDQAGNLANAFVGRPNSPSHRFTIQYDRVNHHKWFLFYDGTAINPPNQIGFASNFVKGCAVIAGSEVISGYDSMGPTRFYNLKWGIFNSFGVSTVSPWPTNTLRLAQGRYNCLPLGVVEHTCGP